jgi:hypothetical protein
MMDCRVKPGNDEWRYVPRGLARRVGAAASGSCCS